MSSQSTHSLHEGDKFKKINMKKCKKMSRLYLEEERRLELLLGIQIYFASVDADT